MRFFVTTSLWTTDSLFIEFVDPTDPKTLVRIDTAGFGCPGDPEEITLTCFFTEIEPPGGPLIPGEVLMQVETTTISTVPIPCTPTSCDDGDPCTIDTCEDGTCVFTPIVCDDGDPCTIDSCENGTCVFTPIVCDDGDPCTIDTCENGDCVFTPIVCDDGDPCTEDVCVDGVCQFIPIDNPTPCCLPDGMCQVLPCAEACDAMGGTPTDSCNGSTTVSLLPTAVFRTPVTTCGPAGGCPAAMAAMIVGLASLRIGARRRRSRRKR